MKKIVFIMGFIGLSLIAKAQPNPFPNLDSLERFINRYVRNSAVEGFQNLRMNTALIGMLRFIQSGEIGSGVDTMYLVGGCTLRLTTGGGDTINVSLCGKLDSVTIETATDPDPDTLYEWRGATRSLVGLIPKGGSSSPQLTTIVRKPLDVLAGDSAMGIPDTLIAHYDSTTITIRTTGVNDSAFTVNTANISTVQRLQDTAAAIRADFPAGSGGTQNLQQVLAVGNVDSSITIHWGRSMSATDSGFVQQKSPPLNWTANMIKAYPYFSRDTSKYWPSPWTLGRMVTNNYDGSQPYNTVFNSWEFGKEGTTGWPYMREGAEQNFYDSYEWHLEMKGIDSVAAERMISITAKRTNPNIGTSSFRNSQQVFSDVNDNQYLALGRGGSTLTASGVSAPSLSFLQSSTDGTTGGFSLNSQGGITYYTWHNSPSTFFRNQHSIPYYTSFQSNRTLNSSDPEIEWKASGQTASNYIMQWSRSSSILGLLNTNSAGQDGWTFGGDYSTANRVTIRTLRSNNQKPFGISIFDGTTVHKVPLAIDTLGRVAVNLGTPNTNWYLSTLGLTALQEFQVYGRGLFTDTLTVTTMGNSDSSDRAASTAWVKRQGFGSGGGGGGTPGGSGSEMQYRVDGSTFGGAAGTSWDNTNKGFTIDVTGLGTTQNNSSGLILSNTSAASSGSQEISPAIRWLGNGYATTPAASRPVEFRADVLPIQGAANPNSLWRLQARVNSGSWADALTVTLGGTVTSTSNILSGGSVEATTNLILGGTGGIFASGRGAISFSSTSNILLRDNTFSSFGILQGGGTTSSFPGWLRSGAKWIARLADNSANTNVEVLDEAYSESTWNGNNDVPTKNAVRDETEANKHKPYSFTHSYAGNTSDATPTNLSSLYGGTMALVDQTTGWIKVTLTGNGQQGASSHNIHGIKYYSFHKNGGTLTLDAADVIVADKKGASVSTATWQLIVSSNQPVLEVTGVAAITMVWGAAIEILSILEN